MTDPVSPAPHHAGAAPGIRKALSPLAGRWRTQGRMHADGRTFAGSDRYDWVAGGHFLLHSWDVQMPDGRTTGIEVIGKRADGDGFSVHAYDDQGGTTASILRIVGDALQIDGAALRFRGHLLDAGAVVDGVWESKEPQDSAWSPLMDLRLVRIEAPAA